MYRRPSNYEKFIFDYDRSEFIECRKELFESNLKRIGTNFSQDLQRNLRIAQSAQNLTQYFDDRLVHYWISDGATLGCYILKSIIIFF